MNQLPWLSSSASANLMATIPISYNYCWTFSDPGHAFLLSLARFKFGGIKVSRLNAGGDRPHRLRVFCQFQTEKKQIRKCSPFLESLLLSGEGAQAPDEWKAVPDIWRSSAEKYGDRVALVDPYHDPPSTITYKQLEQSILDFAEGLRVIGLRPDEKVALFADNSCRWLVADQGVRHHDLHDFYCINSMMASGAINVSRGSRSSVEELLQIYNHSESVALAVDNPEMFNRMAETFYSKTSMRFLILLWGEKSQLLGDRSKELPVFNFVEVMDLGQQSRKALLESQQHYVYEAINSDDVAALLYTSGTTGNAKGVMLTHRNLLHQVDLEHYQPHYLISVPLVYETLYSGIQKQISTSSLLRKLVALTFIRVSLTYMECKRIYEGKCLTKNQNQPSYVYSILDWLWARIIAILLFPVHLLAKKLVYSKIHSAIGITKAGVSGGGSLPMHVDKFFEAIGVKVQNGYGLTETSPVIAARQPGCNVIGSVGHPIQHTEFKVVDSETGEVLPPGSKGILKVRGSQVMKGYYKNPSATDQVIDKDGWLNTGDIGWIVPRHSIGRSRRSGDVIVVEGRAKDTIVLSTGENVEPVELEEAALRSSLIQHIVVVGQDKRRLGAVIVPNKEEVVKTARNLSIIDSSSSDVSKEKVTSLIYKELKTWTSKFPFQIGPILLIDEPFTIDSGLMTPTMKVRREKVVAQYREQIDDMYK
ncbi:probable acyl-activating enzyme 16, chloroplastic isoform X5 [Prosopis cineraria]|uniref:probable acyl-activating enzyme 16, chloroplastic isoform X5 n=1 Tax=Prosopis cineraria TaxID=364024 RepID=UPI00240F309F|nr:probable acyl-activating enzyme 16, chloroplastic isoform X5 [Prosopis cineraria]